MEYSHHVWLRAECKKNEQRTALTPDACKALLTSDPPCKVTVERSDQRIFPDQEYQDVGCEMAETNSWVSAPEDAFLLGIKELPDNDDPLRHTHIYFGHCFKYQDGWMELMSRFISGQGVLLDVEFMVNTDGQRVVAEFGPIAGFVGAAVGLSVWCHQILNPSEDFPALRASDSSEELVSSIKSKLQEVLKVRGLDASDDDSYPKVMVLGALGRCGKGAVDALEKIGIPNAQITKWDLEETPKSGPIPELLEYHLLVNCINLNVASDSTPLFIDKSLIESSDKERKLTVVVDVSCDATNPRNPLPIYSEITTIERPVFRYIVDQDKPPLDIVAVDHLPSLLPRESSEKFSEKILPYVKDLPNRDKNEVWINARKTFQEKVEEIVAAAPKRRNCVIL